MSELEAAAGAEESRAATAPRRARPWWRRLGQAAALGVALLLAGFAAFAWQGRRPADPGPAPEGIAVLTGGPDRVEAGLALLARWPGARLMISGVGPDAGLADMARKAGLEPGAWAERVTLGHLATSTSGNAREVAGWAEARGIQDILVVTAGFHMPRAMLELRRRLPGARLRAHPVAPFTARPLPMLREYAKLLGAGLGLSALTDRDRPTER